MGKMLIAVFFVFITVVEAHIPHRSSQVWQENIDQAKHFESGSLLSDDEGSLLVPQRHNSTNYLEEEERSLDLADEHSLVLSIANSYSAITVEGLADIKGITRDGFDMMAGYSLKDDASNGEKADYVGRVNAKLTILRHASYNMYLNFLRLRRYMAVCPVHMTSSEHFASRTRDNVIRMLRLGLRVGALVGVSNTSAIAHLFSLPPTGEGVVVVLREMGEWTFDEVSTQVEEARRSALVKKHFNSLWVQAGNFKDLYSIEADHRYTYGDLTMNDLFQVFMNFLAHRSIEGEWDEKQVAETVKTALTSGTFRTAAVIEAAVNNRIVAGLGLGYIIVAGILTAIPVTTAVGVTMLIVGGSIAVAGSLVDMTVGNLVKGGLHEHILIVLAQYFAWEMARGCIRGSQFPLNTCPDDVDQSPAVRCDIITRPCSAGQVCLREFLFSRTSAEGEFDNEFKTSGRCSGVFADRPLKAIGKECKLHRECATGYCHFFSRVAPSTEVWADYFARHGSDPDSATAMIPLGMRMVLLDQGVCATPVRLTTEDGTACDRGRGHVVTISKKHRFKACFHGEIHASLKKYFNPALERAVKIRSVGDADVMYGKAQSLFVVQPAVNRKARPRTFYFKSVKKGALMRDFVALRYSPESVIKNGFTENTEPILLSTTPWDQAQLVALVGPLACFNEEWDMTGPKPVCKSRFYLSSSVYHHHRGHVMYGDYVAVLMQVPNDDARETARSIGAEPAVAEHKYLSLASDPLSLGFSKFASLRAPSDVEGTVEVSLRSGKTEVRRTFAAEDVWILKRNLADEEESPERKAVTTRRGRVIRRFSKVSFVPANNHGMELCGSNPHYKEDDDQRQPVTNMCSVGQSPTFGSPWKSKDDKLEVYAARGHVIADE